MKRNKLVGIKKKKRKKERMKKRKKRTKLKKTFTRGIQRSQFEKPWIGRKGWCNFRECFVGISFSY